MTTDRDSCLGFWLCPWCHQRPCRDDCPVQAYPLPAVCPWCRMTNCPWHCRGHKRKAT